VTFVVGNDTLRANVYLVIFAEVLGFLLRVADTVLNIIFSRFTLLSVISVELVVFDLLKEVLSLFTVETIQDGKVFNELFNIRAEVSTTGRASQNVACS